MKIYLVLALFIGLFCGNTVNNVSTEDTTHVSVEQMKAESEKPAIVGKKSEKISHIVFEKKWRKIILCSIIIIFPVIIIASIAFLVVYRRKKDKMNLILGDNKNTKIPVPATVQDTDCKMGNDLNATQDETVSNEEPINAISTNEQNDRFAADFDNCIIIGASARGKGHLQTNLPCQDNHKYTYLGRSWGIAVVSDGAGSAQKSQIGSKIVVERATLHFIEVIKEMKWIENNVLPSNEDWSQISYSVMRKVYDDILSFADAKNIEVKELNATAIVLIHSDMGVLSTHIGDGRSGYRNADGNWLPIITPHKGDEANQTIFITSGFWDRPAFRLSGQLIPESRVIREKITGFTLMSDGCENTSWQVSKIDNNSGKVCDPNRPYKKFYDSVTDTLLKYHYDKCDLNDRADAWFSFLDEGKAFVNEIDDKTMIIGILL